MGLPAVSAKTRDNSLTSLFMHQATMGCEQWACTMAYEYALIRKSLIK